MIGYQTLIVERRGYVGWLIFNRPEAANAMNAVMLGELEQSLAELGGAENEAPAEE